MVCLIMCFFGKYFVWREIFFEDVERFEQKNWQIKELRS